MIKNAHLLSVLNGLSSNNTISTYLFVHYGKLDQEIAVSTIQLIEKKLVLENFDRKIITKTKTVCIEIIQNIIKHQTTHNTIFPYFIIGANGAELTILAGNIITNEEKEIISRSINTFQTIDKQNFKKKYMEALRASALSPEGNAGMGLMDIVMKSDQQLKYEMNKITEDLYSYDLSVILNHQEKIMV